MHLRSVQTSLFVYLYKSWQAAALWKANLTSTTTNSCFSLQVPTCRPLFPCFPLILMQLASECLENLSSILKSLEFWSISIFNTNRCNVNCVCPSVGSYDYTKDDVLLTIWSCKMLQLSIVHLIFYQPWLNWLSRHYRPLTSLLGKKYINSKNIYENVTPNSKSH